MANQRRALLVLGMHRSGTSALTRVLNIHGAALPPDLLPANAGNETGYWESTSLWRFHDDFLQAAGSAWDEPLWFFLEPLAAEVMSEYARRLAALISSEYGDAPLIVVKDPRLCRLMPLWRQALSLLDIQPHAVLMVRHPLESAASMFRRDGMPTAVGQLLWLQYVLAAEHGSRGLPRAAVFYDQLLADCAGEVDRLQAQFGLTFPAGRPAADAEAAAFLQPSLRHERVSDEHGQRRTDLMRWTRLVYEWLERARQAPSMPDDAPELDAVRAELAEAEAVLGPSFQWHRERERQRTAYFTANGEYWKAQTEYLTARLAAVEAEANASKLTADAAARALAEQLEAQLVAASARDKAFGQTLRRLETRVADAEASEAMLQDAVRRLERARQSGVGQWARRLQRKVSGG